jgi:hypothetical protein
MQTSAQQGAGGIARVAKFVHSLAVQTPDSKIFSTNDLEWTDAVQNKEHFKVAAIPKDRLDDFVAGESTRGASNVYCWNKDIWCAHKYGRMLFVWEVKGNRTKTAGCSHRGQFVQVQEPSTGQPSPNRARQRAK